MARILVVEDEHAIADIVEFNLQREGYEVKAVYDGISGLEEALSDNYDLMLLDVMLPGMDGFGVCSKVRETSELPIIMLTAREEETDKVYGLEIGADDYITKPFSMRELLARVHANLRRTVTAPVKDVTVPDIKQGTLEIYFDAHDVRKRGASVELTAREFELLKYMAVEPDKVCSREELLEKVWGYEYYGDLRAVDVAIRRLREKLEDAPNDPQFIITRRGVGYLFASQSN